MSSGYTEITYFRYNKMTKKKKVYALLAGINDYRQPIPKLRGCLHDVAQVKSYLEQTEELDPVFSVLLDKEATKAAIVDGILNFLGKAQSGEVALFYFSGHGTREKAPEVFWASDPDRKLQCLVPYDGIEENKSGPKYNLLANKELRYLINKISENNSHVLTLFDCCHSGGASRNAGGATPRQFIPRFLAGESFPERKWSDFVFSGELSSSRFQSESIKTLLPEGPHIHLAAALPEESAYETDGSGVFTRNLLDLLRRTGNRITYVDLQSLIRNSVKSNFRQTPQVYAGGGQTVFRFFMDLMPMGEGNLINKGEEPFGLMANVNYNKTLGWQMDMGRLQGVSDTQTQIKVESKKGQKDFIALPVKIGPDYTLRKFEGSEPDQS